MDVTIGKWQRLRTRYAAAQRTARAFCKTWNWKRSIAHVLLRDEFGAHVTTMIDLMNGALRHKGEKEKARRPPDDGLAFAPPTAEAVSLDRQGGSMVDPMSSCHCGAELPES
jgi:hypothetical protein